MDKIKKTRLDALDGLRGLAIFFVLMTHIESTLITKNLPIIIKPIIETIFASGHTGVAFLFILSGFLMSYIYPNPNSNLDFLQKRYTRIFPIFISMTLAMLIFRLVPKLNLGLRIFIMLFIAIIFHLIWVKIIQKINNHIVARFLFIIFLLMQLVVLLIYLFIIGSKPPIVFNQLIPGFIREGMIGLVNVTLTLPFGTYVPYLNGVYWSLAAEILFYILYPILCVPLISVIAKQNKIIKTFFLLSLIPFFSAITLISHHILRLDMFFFPFFMFFATGITLGYLFRNRKDLITRTTMKLKHLGNPIIFFVVLIFMRLSLVYTTGIVNDWVRMLWAFPLIFFAAFLLDEKYQLTRFFSSKYLVGVGTISYSVYLSHTAVVDGLHLLFKPETKNSNIQFIILSIVIILSVSAFLYYLLEKPYFNKKIKIDTVNHKPFILPIYILTSIILIVILSAIFFAYQSTFNLLSYEKIYGKEVIISPKVSQNINTLSLRDYPEVDLRIKSSEDRLGIVSSHLVYKFEQVNGGNVTTPVQELVFQIKPANSKEWFSTSTFRPPEIGDSPNHPFGFPMIIDAKNKEYDIRLSLTNKLSAENIYISLEKGSIKAVHQLNKKDFIKNPLKLFPIFIQRMQLILLNQEARLVFVFLTPFLFLLIYLSIKNRT